MVYSAWCPPKRSGEVAIKLRRPEFVEVTYWEPTYDSEGNETSRAQVSKLEWGKKYAVTAKLKNALEDEAVNFKVRCVHYGMVAEESAKVKDGEVEVVFNSNAIGTELLEDLRDGDKLVYKCEAATADGRASKTTEDMPVVFTGELTVSIDPSNIADDDVYRLEDMNGKKYSQEKKVSEGVLKDNTHITLPFDSIIPGITYQLVCIQEGGKDVPVLSDLSFKELLER
jgi:hypothetical protein